MSRPVTPDVSCEKLQIQLLFMARLAVPFTQTFFPAERCETS